MSNGPQVILNWKFVVQIGFVALETELNRSRWYVISIILDEDVHSTK